MHPLDVLDKAVEAKILEDIYVLYNSEITAEKEYQHIEIRYHILFCFIIPFWKCLFVQLCK